MLHVVIQLSYSDNGNDWAKKMMCLGYVSFVFFNSPLSSYKNNEVSVIYGTTIFIVQNSLISCLLTDERKKIPLLPLNGFAKTAFFHLKEYCWENPLAHLSSLDLLYENLRRKISKYFANSNTTQMSHTFLQSFFWKSTRHPKI